MNALISCLSEAMVNPTRHKMHKVVKITTELYASSRTRLFMLRAHGVSRVRVSVQSLYAFLKCFVIFSLLVMVTPSIFNDLVVLSPRIVGGDTFFVLLVILIQ